MPVSRPAQRPRRASDADTEPVATPAPAAKSLPSDASSPTLPAAPNTSPAPPVKNSSPPIASDADDTDPEDVIRINSNLVTIPASIVDTTGKVVEDLKLEDFELRIDGQTKPIGDLGRAETPVRMAVLFDNSDSLRAARELEKQAAIRFFRQVIRPIDEAAIYSVTTETDNALEQPLTNDVPKLVRTIEHFGKPQGATPLFDAIVKAAAYLRPQQGRKVILLVSDGVETTSRLEDFDETLRRVQAADCQIYVVQTGHIENANLRDLVAERRMEQFAAQTGGAVYVPKATSDLDAAFAQIAADLSQQYVLSYYPGDGDARDGRFRTISLRVPARPTLRVRARKGYYTPKG
ncbi:MAG: VWA domain-containing protein [Pyrinomonadaceae bacterium]